MTTDIQRRKNNDRARRYLALLRRNTIAAYGDRCACCNELSWRFLTLDHANDDGFAHRKATGGISATYRDLRDRGYPEGYRVLCVNCNSGRSINGGKCPHTSPVVEPANSQSKRHHRMKLTTIEAYGNECACCRERTPTFLTIDHTNNKGAEHRRAIGNSTYSTYVWLRNQGYPDGFRCLCFNCNSGRHWNGGACPHQGYLTLAQPPCFTGNRQDRR